MAASRIKGTVVRVIFSTLVLMAKFVVALLGVVLLVVNIPLVILFAILGVVITQGWAYEGNFWFNLRGGAMLRWATGGKVVVGGAGGIQLRRLDGRRAWKLQRLARLGGIANCWLCDKEISLGEPVYVGAERGKDSESSQVIVHAHHAED